MRTQDRLLKALSHSDLHYRAFVARQLERVVIHFDSEDVVALVRSSWQEASGPMALHFLCTFNELFPRHLRIFFSPGASPVHSQYLTSARAKVGAPARARPEGRDAICRSATQLLEPCILALRRRLDGASGRERRVLMATLARFHHGAVESFLVERLADDADGPMAAFLLAACFGTLDDQKVLDRMEAVWSQDTLPQYLLALRYLPTDSAAAFLRRAARHKSPAVQWLSAACLDRFAKFDLRPALESILEGQFGWAVAHAMETIGRVADPSIGLPLVQKALESFDHPLVRSAAFRALAIVGSKEGIDLCLKEIASPSSPHAQAQAIAALPQLGAPAPLRARVLAPLVRAPNLEVAGQALLGLVGADATAAGKAIRDMIVEGGEDERVQAAYCLGYYPGDSSVRVLEHLVRTDPSPAVRQQAVRAFSYFERGPSVTKRLNAFLELEDERVVMDAIRILTSPGQLDESVAAEGIGAVARYGASGPVRRLAARALGRFESRQARSYVEETLGNKSADPDTLLGAVEGMEWAAPPGPNLDGLRGQLTNPVPAVRAAAARGLFSWGEVSGLPVLAEMMCGSGTEAREATKALEVIATICDYLVPEPRFLPLAETLRVNLKTPEYQEFSRRELGLVAEPAEPVPGVDPHAAVLSQRTEQSLEFGGETAGHVLADIDAARRKYNTRKAGRRTRTLQQETPPLPGPEDRVGSGRRVRPWMVGVAGVLLGAAVFGGYAWLSGGAGEPEAAPSASSAVSPGTNLVVGSVRGVARVGKAAGGAAEIVGPDALVEPGQQVSAAKDSVVRLGTNPPGNSLLLMGEGGFSYDGIEIENLERRQVAVRVSGVTGQLVFDMKWGRP
ncbi:MAG: HEAT repeat domain-containing protein, partial [Candidatus Wallbacteria bacterium]|nr:HEAT repeat domain-containing protein [Candidatus Wallbacteria bacterium]